MVYSVHDCSACSNSAVHDDCDVCSAMWNNRDNNLEASAATEQMKHMLATSVKGAVWCLHGKPYRTSLFQLLYSCTRQ